MKPVDQTIVAIEDGDCTRACLASILELPIDAVPNFMRFPKWFDVMQGFLRSLDYNCYGTGFPHSHKIREYAIKGFVIASVDSRTFKNTTHSVVVNSKGVCVHDPNPNLAWKGVNVVKTKALKHWLLIAKKGKKDSPC